MSEFKVASRYAKSLLDLSIEQSQLDAVKGDMEQFIEVLRSNKELQAVLKNPIMKQDKKQNILNALFKDKIHPSILAFFGIMVRKGRSGILYGTAHEFIRLYNEYKGIVKATVTSATELSEQNFDALKTILAEETKSEIILTNVVNPELIGGFVVKVGDKQIDASIAGRLHKLEKHLIK